jgi:hypothetical protein
VSFDQTGNFAASTNYTVHIGSSSVIARVSTADLDLVGQPIPTGPVKLTGIVSQFDTTSPHNGVYEILLRSMTDIQPCSALDCYSCPGDTSGNLTLNGGDVQRFVDCFVQSNGGPPTSGCGCADMNGDSLINSTDMLDASQGFVALVLSGASCP